MNFKGPKAIKIYSWDILEIQIGYKANFLNTMQKMILRYLDIFLLQSLCDMHLALL